MGILANMACTAEVCKEMVEHPRLRYAVGSLQRV